MNRLLTTLKRRVKEYNLHRKRFPKLSKVLVDNGRFTCNWENRMLIDGEDTSTTCFDAHYVFHTAWAARILSQKKPELHVDISSDIRFVTLVSAFIPIDFYDYRPVNFALSGLQSKQGDLMKLPFKDNSVGSISCMHVVEHIGLERYGDPLDAQGDLKAITELKRVLKPGGNLYFVLPVGGKALIQYNAHRIYTYDMIVEYFSELKLANFALITDNGEFVDNATRQMSDKQHYGCGCWLFEK